ncbi:XkdX family protein [Clostridium baratii]|uniref:XkdX family protein n=1 Tax=Clostridium baratii TaxID=1561 RepID=UPI00290230F0|nr:XkdX family protein [Clostridium baratii]MDU1053449.1 XkdX family protein [Clostridium baratii]
MNNDINYDFWKMAYDMKAIDENLLGQAIKCTKNPYGEISPEQYKEICNQDFIE